MANYPQPQGARLTRGRTDDLWMPLNVDALQSGPGFGFYKDWDFVDALDDVASWSKADAPAGAGTAATTDGNLGLLRLTSTAVTAHHGVQLQLGQATTAMSGTFTPTAGGVFAMEMFGLLTASTLPRLFMGLSTKNDSPLSSTGTLADSADAVGIAAVTTIGLLTSAVRAASATAVLGATAHTLVTAKYVKIGMRLTGTSLLELWINGVKKATSFNVTSGLPTAIMVPTIELLSGGTAAPVFDLDWVAVGWKYRPELIVE